MRTVLIASVFLTLAACSSSQDCLPATSSRPPDCPMGTYIDAMNSDPICLSAVSGLPFCRVGANACYVCTGSQFTDGCYVRSGNAYECVHACSEC
jgi:hypothetical protein